MAPPAASVFHVSASFLVPGLLLLLAVTAASFTAGDTNTTVSATSGNRSSAQSTPTTADDGHGPPEQYVCYLCGGRDPILMRWCPVYWDECHLVCYAPEVAATATATATGRALSAGEDHDGCYVMKLYSNGSYVIVTRISCAATDSCLLSCGGGDAATAGTGPLVSRGVSPPRADEFGPRCGTQ